MNTVTQVMTPLFLSFLEVFWNMRGAIHFPLPISPPPLPYSWGDMGGIREEGRALIIIGRGRSRLSQQNKGSSVLFIGSHFWELGETMITDKQLHMAWSMEYGTKLSSAYVHNVCRLVSD